MAKITATFDQRVTRNGYYLGVTISEYPATDPETLEPCLLVDLNGPGNLVRAATLLDLNNYISTGYNLWLLTSDGWFNSLEVGDIFNFFTIPETWEITEEVETLSLPVNSIDSASAHGSVHVDCSMLHFGEFTSGFEGELDFEVTRDGAPFLERAVRPLIAGRYTPGAPLPVVNQVTQLYYRVKRSGSIFSTVAEAVNKMVSIKAELQSLVDESNTAGTDFEIVTEEVFE
jgi:hypothetical protein